MQEQSERTIVLGAKTITRIWNLKSTQEGSRVATEGFERKLGYLSPSFYRYQTAISLFGIEKVTEDRVSLDVIDYSYSGGNEQEWLYVNNVDLRQPTIPYDERLANVVKACLEQSTDSSEQK
ncbi:MAG TPA: hypothetical protein VMR95_04160 [Candidatus Binatia bacterium]|nr:hypothetical protein [Candidatus Binatia bacterium]